MGKFEIPSKVLANEPLYAGEPLPALNKMELAYRKHIANGTMVHGEAKRVLEQMNPNNPIATLAGFARLIAAVVRVFRSTWMSRTASPRIRKRKRLH